MNSATLLQQPSTAMTSRQVLLSYIKTLSKHDLRKLLTPVRDGLLTEETVIYINTQNFSIDHVIVPMTIKQLLNEIGVEWKKWIHHLPSKIHFTEASHHASNHEEAMSDQQLLECINDMNKLQKRSMLNLVRDGFLTDECFINLSHYKSPERVQIPLLRVVDTLRDAEDELLSKQNARSVFMKVLQAKHYSSADFSRLSRSDLDVRRISAARCTMPIWYTLLFAVMGIATAACQIWAQTANYVELEKSISDTATLIVLIVTTTFVILLLYLTLYIVAFLWCCENNLSTKGLLMSEKNYSSVHIHFCEMYIVDYRILATKVVQFVLLLYSIILIVLANENAELNLYPALTTVLTNGFGLLLFARISQFLRQCKRTRKGTAIAAR